MKKLLLVGVLIVGALWVCKRTNVCSYASTLWAKGQRAMKNQVPRQFELDRIRHEIDKLDADVQAMVGPVAEKQAAMKRLQREITTARENHQRMRQELLALTEKVESGARNIRRDDFGEECCTPEQAKAKLARAFALFKAADTNLKTREKLLAAQQKSINLALEQLRKIAEQKGLFEARLAQLQATEEHLGLQQVTSPLRVDEGRVADIKNTLDSIEQAQETEQEARILHGQFGPKTQGASSSCCPAVNTQEIRTFLNVPAGNNPKVANNK